MFSRCLFFAFLAVVLFPLYAFSQGSAMKERSPMEKKHHSAKSDHQVWRAEIGKMRAEHQSALAALARLEADLLAHDAELQKMTVQIDLHELEMGSHNHAHDDSEKGDQDGAMKAENARFMGEHTELKEIIDGSQSHHKKLINGILKFTREHMNEFHAHSHGDGSQSKAGHADGHQGNQHGNMGRQ